MANQIKKNRLKWDKAIIILIRKKIPLEKSTFYSNISMQNGEFCSTTSQTENLVYNYYFDNFSSDEDSYHIFRGISVLLSDIYNINTWKKSQLATITCLMWNWKLMQSEVGVFYLIYINSGELCLRYHFMKFIYTHISLFVCSQSQISLKSFRVRAGWALDALHVLHSASFNIISPEPESAPHPRIA